MKRASGYCHHGIHACRRWWCQCGSPSICHLASIWWCRRSYTTSDCLSCAGVTCLVVFCESPNAQQTVAFQVAPIMAIMPIYVAAWWMIVEASNLEQPVVITTFFIITVHCCLRDSPLTINQRTNCWLWASLWPALLSSWGYLLAGDRSGFHNSNCKTPRTTVELH